MSHVRTWESIAAKPVKPVLGWPSWPRALLQIVWVDLALQTPGPTRRKAVPGKQQLPQREATHSSLWTHPRTAFPHLCKQMDGAFPSPLGSLHPPQRTEKKTAPAAPRRPEASDSPSHSSGCSLEASGTLNADEGMDPPDQAWTSLCPCGAQGEASRGS